MGERAENDAIRSTATERLCSMATFRDGDVSRRQIGTQLDQAQADFARCLAMSGWAIAKPLRLIVFGLPMRASLDECLLARLRDAGHELRGLEDETLRPCLDGRWEFIRGNEYRPARYRPGPSYHERLRVELLVDAWQRASRGSADIDALESIARSLAAATSALAAHLALPVALLRRAAAKRRLDAAAEERLQRQLKKAMLEFAEDDIRHLAIAAALTAAPTLPAPCGATVRRRCRCCCVRMSSGSRRRVRERRSNPGSHACASSFGRRSRRTARIRADHFGTRCIQEPGRRASLQRQCRRCG